MGESENARARVLFGLTLRQTVVLGVIAYASVMGLFIARSFRSYEKSSANPHIETTLRDHALSSEEELESAIDADGADGSFNGMYHSPSVFEMNYEDMALKLKIFVYPGDDHSFKALSGDLASGEWKNTDELFIHQLYQSDFVTLDPEKAHLLLLPLSIRSLLEDSTVGPEKLGKWLSKYVQGLRDEYPYWARTLGADHVLVTCTPLAADGSRNVLELTKNAIQVACSPLVGQAFFPHKDVAIPLYQEIPPPPGEGVRSALAYYHGDTGSESLYESLGVAWENDPQFQFEAPDVEPSVHYQRLSTSKYCLILGPKDYPDIVGALRYGCVPVLVSDGKLYDLPFQDVLNWNQFAIILSLKTAKNAKALLAEVDEGQYLIMQYLAREAGRHLEWHDPPVDKDAFFLTLYDLWMRRHAIRYVRRDEL